MNSCTATSAVTEVTGETPRKTKTTGIQWEKEHLIDMNESRKHYTESQAQVCSLVSSNKYKEESMPALQKCV